MWREQGYFPAHYFLNTDFSLVVVVVVAAASRLFPAGTLHAVSQSVHPAEEFGPQHSGQHPVKGTQTPRQVMCWISLRWLTFIPFLGTCRWVRVCSERQRGVHAAGRRPGLPAALCAWRQCGGSDVCSGACSQSLPRVCGGWGKATLTWFSLLAFRFCFFYECIGLICIVS